MRQAGVSPGNSYRFATRQAQRAAGEAVQLKEAQKALARRPEQARLLRMPAWQQGHQSAG